MREGRVDSVQPFKLQALRGVNRGWGYRERGGAVGGGKARGGVRTRSRT
jgi:hypothetical protein